MAVNTWIRAALALALSAYGPSAFAHGTGHAVDETSQMPPVPDNPGEPRWLAGDHHVHSRYSVGLKPDTDPPEPVIGGDAIYPIPMNALMARRFGLEWMVATDHGGPNHSKVNHDRAYPELVLSRELVPEVVQFFGIELNSPGADHSSVIVPAGEGEAERLRTIEAGYDSREAWPPDPARDTEPKMIEALHAMQQFENKPVVFAHHPSRSATALGEYGKTAPAELRAWNDAAPGIAVGMEGAPGHQAAGQAGDAAKAVPRGFYRGYPTMGGFDQMTARLGGFWDSMLGEGRRWWITANSDSHVHWSEGGIDFWPGEYSKTYVHSAKDPASILEALRSGNIFVTTGDLISALDVEAGTAHGSAPLPFGGVLAVHSGERLKLTIRFLDPEDTNAHGDNPAVMRVDLIRGQVRGRADAPERDSNPTTRVERRFTAKDWRRDGPYRVIEYTLKPLKGEEYIRLRGTSTAELEPQPDVNGEPVWDDLWFYSNPIFLRTGP